MWSLGCRGDPTFEENKGYLGTLVILGHPIPVHSAAVPTASLFFPTPKPLRATKVYG